MKIKVIIADDERDVCEAMQKSINWEELDMDCIGIAKDGQELLDLIYECSPDVVITDIRMPVMSGLEVIQKTVEDGIDVEYILVSGYKDFEYARRAMSCGVNEYLPKPFSKAEIIIALKNCAERFREKIRVKQLSEMLEGNEELLSKSLVQQFIRDVVVGTKCIDSMKSELGDIASFEKYNYRLIMLMDDSENYVKLINISELFFAKMMVVFSTIINEAVILLIKNSDLKEILNCIKQLKHNYKEVYGRTIFSAVGGEVELKDLRSRYLLLKKVSDSSFLYDSDEILLVDEDDAENPDEVFEIDEYGDISEEIRSGNVEGIYEKVEQIFETMKKQNLNKDLFKATCIEWIVRMNSQVLSDEKINIVNYVTDIQKSNSIDGIKSIVSEVFAKLSKSDIGTKGSYAENLIQKIKKIIEEEYIDSELTIKRIGEEKLFLTPDYISRIFKRKTGISLNNYINIYRIGKAKELLNQKKYKIYEVAEMTGFDGNSQYFSQVFKKIVGISPKEYEDEQK